MSRGVIRIIVECGINSYYNSGINKTTELYISKIYLYCNKPVSNAGGNGRGEIVFNNMDKFKTLSIESLVAGGYSGTLKIYGDNNVIYTGGGSTSSFTPINISGYSTIKFEWSKTLYTDEKSSALTINELRFT